LLCRLGRRFHEHVALLLRLLDPTTRNLKVARLVLNTDKAAPHLDGGNAGCAGALEWVKNDAARKFRDTQITH
jgi:hypothetical protein